MIKRRTSDLFVNMARKGKQYASSPCYFVEIRAQYEWSWTTDEVHGRERKPIRSNHVKSSRTFSGLISQLNKEGLFNYWNIWQKVLYEQFWLGDFITKREYTFNPFIPIFNLSKPWKAKGKFEIDHSWEWKAGLTVYIYLSLGKLVTGVISARMKVIFFDGYICWSSGWQRIQSMAILQTPLAELKQCREN